MNKLLQNIDANDLETLGALLKLLQGNNVKKDKAITLGKFFKEYKEFIKKSLSKAYYASITVSEKHLVEYFGKDVALQSLNKRKFENFILDLQKKVPKGCYVYYRNYKAAFNKAVEWEYIEVNPLLKIKLKRRQKTAPAFINENELYTIISNIENECIRNICITAFNTGMRLGEVINLKWGNVNLEKKRIVVGDDNFMTKGRKQRYIPISNKLFILLSELVKQKGKIIGILTGKDKKNFVFTKDNGFLFSADYVSKKFKKACIAAKTGNEIHFHSLRHSFASQLVMNGVPLYTVKELLGHTSITTTEIYSHLNIDSLKDAISTLDRKEHNKYIINK